jgi:hypothetical protein
MNEEQTRIDELKKKGVAVCDKHCQECSRALCTGAAALATECCNDAKQGLANAAEAKHALERIGWRCIQVVEAAAANGDQTITLTTTIRANEKGFNISRVRIDANISEDFLLALAAAIERAIDSRVREIINVAGECGAEVSVEAAPDSVKDEVRHG